MAQMKIVSWTNPATAVVRNESVGFTVTEVLVTNLTDGGQFYWNSAFTDGYYLTVSSGTITTSNGFTPIAQDALFGAPITDVSNAASAVVTASYLAQFDFAVGDNVKIVDVADDLTGTTLNLTSATVSAVDATTVTVSTNTSSGYSTYVSGGYLVRVADSDGIPVPIRNRAIRGLTLGSGVVGGNSDSMVAVFRGENSVV